MVLKRNRSWITSWFNDYDGFVSPVFHKNNEEDRHCIANKLLSMILSMISTAGVLLFLAALQKSNGTGKQNSEFRVL